MRYESPPINERRCLKQKKQAEKEALDPDANYTEDKGDFEIPTEDETGGTR